MLATAFKGEHACMSADTLNMQVCGELHVLYCTVVGHTVSLAPFSHAHATRTNPGRQKWVRSGLNPVSVSFRSHDSMHSVKVSSWRWKSGSSVFSS